MSAEIEAACGTIETERKSGTLPTANSPDRGVIDEVHKAHAQTLANAVVHVALQNCIDHC